MWLVGGIAGGIGLLGLLTLIVVAVIIFNWPGPRPIAPTPHLFTASAQPDTTGPEILKPFAQPDLSFYGPDVSSCGTSVADLIMIVRDESRVDRVEIVYRYESDGIEGEWHSLSANDVGGGQYQTFVDHNVDEQALRALDGLDGLIRWSVVAADEYGNMSSVENLVVQVHYCQTTVGDATGPQVTEQFAKPDPTNYGPDAAGCGALELMFTVAASDPSGVANVEIWFRYEGRGNTDWHTVTAQPGGGEVYQAVINNNQYNPYDQLGAAGGVVRWYAIVVDNLGSTTKTPDQTVAIVYCIG